MATDELRAALVRATAKRARASRAEKAAYRELVDAVVAAADGGVQQVDIVRDTGLTRERIRQIVGDERDRRLAALNAQD